ncbi:MAG: hypothetical protein V7K26_30570, partial [Nostoc sp.]
MNSGLTYEQETFVQDSIPVRLGKLVTNLARINQLFSDSTHEDVVKSLIRETMYFLEWIAPDIDIDNRLIRKWQMLTGTGFEKLGYNRRSLKGATKK